MLILIAALLPYSNIEQKDFIEIITTTTPDFIDPIVTQLIKDAFRHSTGLASGGIISVALFALIYAASRGSMTLIRTLNVIYDCKEQEKTFRANLKAVATTLVFIFALFVSLVAMVFGNSIRNSIKISMPDFKNHSLLLSNIRYAVIFFLLTGFFSMLYTHLPDKKNKMEDQLFGAVFSSLGWGLFSYVFSILIKGGSIYRTYYGSLSTLVIFLVWLYWCFLIFLFGAYINENIGKVIKIKKYYDVTEVYLLEKYRLTFKNKRRNNGGRKKRLHTRDNSMGRRE